MRTVKYQEYRDTLEALEDRFARDGIHFHNLSGRQEPIHLGVRWASVGTVTPDEAVRFTDRILDAAMLAKEFRYDGYVIDYSG